MKIPYDIKINFLNESVARGQPDIDTGIVMDLFDEEQEARILEVGAHDEPLSNILAGLGYNVTGIDLREYDTKQSVQNYHYIQADFCDLPDDFLRENTGKFDSIIAISAIEHFGLTTYGEGRQHPYYDVIAMRIIRQLLKMNGTCYITVPYGHKHVDVDIHWRIYNSESIMSRLYQDFNVEIYGIVVSGGGVVINGVTRGLGELLSREEVSKFEKFASPHITIAAKLRKVPLNRLAPTGL